MATIKFLLQGTKNNTPIYLRLSLGRSKEASTDEKPKYLSFKRKVGININPKEWGKKGFPKQNNPENKNTTTQLQKLETFVFEKLNTANSNAEVVNGDWLQFQIDLFFNRVNENNESDLLIDAIQSVIDCAEIRKNAKGGVGLSRSRINSYKALKKTIIEYQGSKSIKVKDVNIKFANELLMHLLNDKGYQKSYAMKKIADLKTVCYNAESNGIETNPRLKNIESTKTTSEYIIYLTPNELKQIEETTLLSKALQNARKWLLLGCNIGQRGGDLLELNENNFVDRNGLEVIELKQQKTGKNITIPVLGTTKEILKTGLPHKISIQKFNDYIKEVCKIAELNETTEGKIFDPITKRKTIGQYPKWRLITSHICRRSFASNLYTELPTPLLMQITGHSTEKMFLKYIGKNSIDYAQQIADFYNLQAQKESKTPQLNIIKNVANL
jgi:integrase